MKFTCTKTFISKILLVGLFSNYALASWPVFTVPNRSFLETEGLLDESSCSANSAKLIPNIAINIKKNLCRTFCSPDWQWLSKSDGECHKLSSEFAVIDYQVQHVSDSTGTNYSVVAVVYGNQYTHAEAFRFILTTQENQGWYCTVLNGELGLITCANDI